MVCFNCKSQIPDNVTTCPNCGAPVMYQTQVKKEIKLRRWQRWVLYAVIAVVFIGMTAYAVMIYLNNAALMTRVASVTQNLETTRQELEGTKTTLGQREGQLAQSKSEITQYQGQISEKDTKITELTASQEALTKKTDDYQKTISDYQKTIDTQTQTLQGYRQFSTNLGADNANVFNTLVQLGIGTSNKELSKILVADWNLGNATDTDKDGLSDVVEAAVGTDPTKADTDSDKYSDKDEMLRGYNPLGAGKLPIDQNFTRANSGKILIQIDGQKEAWYINPKDLKRYYLGRPGEAVKALQELQNIQAQ